MIAVGNAVNDHYGSSVHRKAQAIMSARYQRSRTAVTFRPLKQRRENVTSAASGAELCQCVAGGVNEIQDPYRWNPICVFGSGQRAESASGRHPAADGLGRVRGG